MLRNLYELGEIIQTKPSIEDIENERFENSFTVTLSTQLNEHEIRRSVRAVSDVEDVHVEPHVEKAVEERRAMHVPETAELQHRRALVSGAKHVRISTEKLDTIMNLVGELVIGRSRLIEISRNRNVDALPSALAHMERTISDLQYEVTDAHDTGRAHIQSLPETRA